MFLVVLFWAALGLTVALAVRAAHVWPAAYPAPRWRWLLLAGALAGLIGGWLGSLAFGRFYGVPTALWVSGLLVARGPWLMVWLRDRLAGARERG
jgi:hypothetical protein